MLYLPHIHSIWASWIMRTMIETNLVQDTMSYIEIDEAKILSG